MADKRISQLNSHTSPSGSDLLVIVNNNETKKITYADLTAQITGSATDLSGLNSFTASYLSDSASFDDRITQATNEQDLSRYAVTSSNDFTGYQSALGFNADILTANSVANLRSISGIADTTITIVSPVELSEGITGSIAATNGVVSGSQQISRLGFAITGSNTFRGNQVISGSLKTYIAGGSATGLNENPTSNNVFWSYSTNDTNTTAVQIGWTAQVVGGGTYTVTNIQRDVPYNPFIAITLSDGGLTLPYRCRINFSSEAKLWQFNETGGLVFPDSSSQYTAFTGIPSGTISGSSQLNGLGFATTGSNTFESNQWVKGYIVFGDNGQSSIDFLDNGSTLVLTANQDIKINAPNGDIILNADGDSYLRSANAGNGIVTDGYLETIIGDGTRINTGTGHSITDNLDNIINSIPSISSLNAFTSSYFTDSSSFDGKISTQEGRIDAILSASTADADTFAEIVTLINSVDLTNDNAFATYYTSSNARITSLENATSSYETKGRGIVSSSQQVIDLGFVTTSSFNTFSESVDVRLDVLETYSGSYTGSFSGSHTGSAYFDYIIFNSSSAVPLQSYMLQANTTDKTLDLRMGNNATLQMGQELYYPPIVNKSGVDLSDGDLVMINPAGVAQGNRISVVKAIGDGTYPADYIVGVLTEDVANNAEGFATWFGYVRNVSKTHLQPAGETWVEGDILYPNPTIAGKMTNVLPTAPALKSTIAAITSINGNNVTLLVRPALRGKLDTLHNINLTTATYGDLLMQSGSNGVWINSKQLSGSYGITGSLTATTIIGSIEATNGLISGSSQLTGSLDTRYTLSGSVQNVSLPNGLISSSTQISDYGFISSSHTDITALNAFTSSYFTTSASFDSRITSLVTAGVPAGTVSGSSQLTSSYDSRYVLSGSVQSLPSGIYSSSEQLPSGLISSSTQINGFETIGRSIISSSAQISAYGFISSSHTDITSLNVFTASYFTDSASVNTKVNDLISHTSSYETNGRGIISESVVTISGTTPDVGVGNLWYDSNNGNMYLHYDTNTWVDTSNGVIQSIISDGSLLSTASFNAWTASYTASVPVGTISGSAQITSFGFVSGSYETTGRGIISSSAQLSSLGYVTSGGNVTFNSVTANQYIVSSSVYYVTASYSSGSTISGNTLDDTHQFTGSVSITGSLTITGSLNLSPSASLGAKLWQLQDVNDTASGSITNGYQLAWNSSTSLWEPTAGATAKGSIRLYMATNRSNASAFYFNANTRTASDSASPSSDTAFMVTTALLNKVTVYLRQDGAGPNSTQIAIYKNANGSAFSTAGIIASASLSLTTDTIQTYTFTGLTLNQFDSLHVYCDPTSTPGTLYSIVTVE